MPGWTDWDGLRPCHGTGSIVHDDNCGKRYELHIAGGVEDFGRQDMHAIRNSPCVPCRGGWQRCDIKRWTKRLLVHQDTHLKTILVHSDLKSIYNPYQDINCL